MGSSRVVTHFFLLIFFLEPGNEFGLHLTAHSQIIYLSKLTKKNSLIILGKELTEIFFFLPNATVICSFLLLLIFQANFNALFSVVSCQPGGHASADCKSYGFPKGFTFHP